MKQIRAIIADDEEALRHSLRIKLAGLWPDMVICGEAGDGAAALKLAQTLAPDIAFLDIKMPGLSGIEVARELPGGCLPVFITAHDEFALKAFETGAIDYVLKPVVDSRLEKTVQRLKTRVADPSFPQHNMREMFDALALAGRTAREHLQWITVQQKDSVRLLSVNEICYFKAADKYTLVRTKDKEYVISKTIKELAAELSPDQFWQVHRATLVNVAAIDMVVRSFTGRYELRLKGLRETLAVSRSYSHLFRQM